MLECEYFIKSEIFVNGFFLDNSRFFHTFAPTFNLLAYEKNDYYYYYVRNGTKRWGNAEGEVNSYSSRSLL